MNNYLFSIYVKKNCLTYWNTLPLKFGAFIIWWGWLWKHCDWLERFMSILCTLLYLSESKVTCNDAINLANILSPSVKGLELKYERKCCLSDG